MGCHGLSWDLSEDMVCLRQRHRLCWRRLDTVAVEELLVAVEAWIDIVSDGPNTIERILATTRM